jgi:putative membrane protein
MEEAMRFPLVMVAWTLAIGGPSAAQIGNPAGVPPGTAQSAPGVPAPHETNVQDRLFVQLAAAGGAAEVDFARLAEGKAQTSAVKEFARRMVQDHSEANRQLEQLAIRANIPVPRELDPDHKNMRAELDSTDGRAFDLAYMQGQVIDHQKSAILLQWEIGQGQNAELQRFAAATLPTVLTHLEIAKNVLAELSGQGPQASAVQGASPPAPDRREQPAAPAQRKK